jgi:hypothetical protein
MELTDALKAYSESEKRITHFWGVSTSLTVIVIGGLLTVFKDEVHLDIGPKLIVYLVYAIAHVASMFALLAEYKIFVALAEVCEDMARASGTQVLGDALKGWSYRARKMITIAIHAAYELLVLLLILMYWP